MVKRILTVCRDFGVVALLVLAVWLGLVVIGLQRNIITMQDKLRISDSRVEAVNGISEDMGLTFRLVDGIAARNPKLKAREVSDISLSILRAYKAHRDLGLTLPMICGVIQTESNFLPTALSAKGAMGEMQLMPETAKVYMERDGYPYDLNLLYNPTLNITWGCRHLVDLHVVYEGLPTVRDPTWRNALLAYLGGAENLRSFLIWEHAGRKSAFYIPKYEDYPRAVLDAAAEWQEILYGTAKH